MIVDVIVGIWYCWGVVDPHIVTPVLVLMIVVIYLLMTIDDCMYWRRCWLLLLWYLTWPGVVCVIDILQPHCGDSTLLLFVIWPSCYWCIELIYRIWRIIIVLLLFLFIVVGPIVPWPFNDDIVLLYLTFSTQLRHYYCYYYCNYCNLVITLLFIVTFGKALYVITLLLITPKYCYCGVIVIPHYYCSDIVIW